MSEIVVDRIVSVGDNVSSERDTLSVLWAITKACNFDCSYCVYKKSVKNNVYSSKEMLLGAAETILRMGRPAYQITLYGGEPTLHPNFLDLTDYLLGHEPRVALRMFTNGSRSRDFFENLAGRVRGSKFGTIFSYHPEFAKFDRYIAAIEVMAKAGLPVAVNYMFSPTHRSEAELHIGQILRLREVCEFYIEINFTYNSAGVLGTGTSEDDISWINEVRSTIDAMKVNSNQNQSPNFCRILSTITTIDAGVRTVHGREASAALLARMNVPSYKDFYCCSGANVLFIEENGVVRGGSARRRQDWVIYSSAMRSKLCKIFGWCDAICPLARQSKIYLCRNFGTKQKLDLV